MARIPISTPGAAPSPVAQPLARNNNNAARALAAVGQSATSIGAAIEEREQRDGTIYAAKALADARAKWASDAIQRQEGAAIDGAGYAAGFQADFDTYAEQAKNQAPAAAQLDIELGLAQIKAQYLPRAQAFEATRRVAHRSDMVMATIRQERNALLDEPGGFDEALISTEAAIEAAGFSAAVEADLKREASQGLALGALQGQLVRDPVGTLAQLEAGRWDARLRPEDKLALMQAAKPEAGKAIAQAAWSQAEVSGAMMAAASDGDYDQAAKLIMPSLIWQESRGRTGLTSPKGAMGMTQMMPGTAQAAAARLGIKYDADRLLNDAEYATRLGTEEMRHLLERYEGNMILALSAYNAGPGNTDKWIERFGDPRTGQISSTEFARAIPFRETNNYVREVLGRTGTNGARGEVAEIADPAVRRAAESEISAFEQERTAATRQFLEGFDEYRDFLRSGRTPDPLSRFTKSALIQNLGALQGQAAWDELQQAIADGEMFAALKNASPEQEAEIMADLATATDDPIGFRDGAAQQEQAQRVRAEKHRMLANDPAAYVAAHTPAVRDFAEAEEFDPIGFARAQVESQRHLGVREMDIRVISNGQAAQIVADISAMPSDQVAGQMRTLEQEWGDYYEIMLASLAEAGLSDAHYLAGIYSTDPALAQDIITTGAAGRKALMEGLDATTVQLIKSGTIELHDKLAPWRQAFEAGAVPGDAAGEFNRLASVMETWVTGQIRAGNENAVDDAITRFMAAKYLEPFSSEKIKALVPNDWQGQALTESMIESATESLQAEDAIRAFGPQAFGLPDGAQRRGGFDDADMVNMTVMAARWVGFWTTNSDGDGLVLMVPMANGTTLPLTNADGEAYQVLFSDIAG